MYTGVLHLTKKGIPRIEVLDPGKTNALFLWHEIKNLGPFISKQHAQLMKAVAVITEHFDTDKPMSGSASKLQAYRCAPLALSLL